MPKTEDMPHPSVSPHQCAPAADTARHLIRAGATLREAFQRLNALSGGTMTLFVTDAEGRLVGSLTDGDLRRAIIASATLADSVEGICRRPCMSVAPGDDRYRRVRQARDKGIQLLPVTDGQGVVVSLLDLRTLRTSLPLDAVLMAGGKGERLRPLTLDCPKPLLPVGGRPIIDYNIEELRANGIRNIFVTVNYLKERLIGHFAGTGVRCVEEPRRLGTMGSLAYVDGLEEDNLVVMNSDLLTSLDFEQMYLQHIESGAMLTMAAIPYTVSVPFAIVRHEGRRITGLTEKPTYNYYANAGVYMMRREVTRLITKGEYLDAPDLVEQLIARGDKVEYFPIDGTWVDIGSPDDYRYADELMGGTLGRRRNQ
ncbi:MAG: nucleotidyltransferase family protein [Muribaculaceae bacterium]|nr:nucleotidyltransferase family protein [Muribaculaceae bacterium]